MIHELIAHIKMHSNIRIIDNQSFTMRLFFPSMKAGFDYELNTIYYKPNEITLRIFLHELVHATGLKLNRKFYPRGTIEYNIEENIADRVAIQLLANFNMLDQTTLECHKKYLQVYPIGNISIDSQVATAYNFILQNWLVGFNINKAA